MDIFTFYMQHLFFRYLLTPNNLQWSDVSLISAWISPFPVLEIDAIEMKNNVDTVFRKLDLTGAGNVTREEFVESCLQVLIYPETQNNACTNNFYFQIRDPDWLLCMNYLRVIYFTSPEFEFKENKN